MSTNSNERSLLAALTFPSFGTMPVIQGTCLNVPFVQIVCGCSIMNAPSAFGSITGRYNVIGSTDQIFKSSIELTRTDTSISRSLSINSVVVRRSMLSIPTTSAWRFANANGFGVGSLYGAVAKPLITMPRWKRPSDNGLIMCMWTDAAPADAPIIVIESGSPPNALIFFLIHFNASAWSFNPKLPGLAASPVDKKPELEWKWKLVN